MLTWSELGALLFLFLIWCQLVTLLFWPSIVILEPNKWLVGCEVVGMGVFILYYWWMQEMD